MVGFKTRKDGRVFPTSKPSKAAVSPVVTKKVVSTNLSPVQLEMAKQIGAKELKFAKFNLMRDGDNTLIVNKGTRSISIKYDEGTDTYTVRKVRRTRNFDIEEDETTHVFFEDLRPMIERHFPRFEYVMDSLVVVSKSSNQGESDPVKRSRQGDGR